MSRVYARLKYITFTKLYLHISFSKKAVFNLKI